MSAPIYGSRGLMSAPIYGSRSSNSGLCINYPRQTIAAPSIPWAFDMREYSTYDQEWSNGSSPINGITIHPGGKFMYLVTDDSWTRQWQMSTANSLQSVAQKSIISNGDNAIHISDDGLEFLYIRVSSPRVMSKTFDAPNDLSSQSTGYLALGIAAGTPTGLDVSADLLSVLITFDDRFEIWRTPTAGDWSNGQLALDETFNTAAGQAGGRWNSDGTQIMARLGDTVEVWECPTGYSLTGATKSPHTLDLAAAGIAGAVNVEHSDDNSYLFVTSGTKVYRFVRTPLPPVVNSYVYDSSNFVTNSDGTRSLKNEGSGGSQPVLMSTANGIDASAGITITLTASTYVYAVVALDLITGKAVEQIVDETTDSIVFTHYHKVNNIKVIGTV